MRYVGLACAMSQPLLKNLWFAVLRNLRGYVFSEMMRCIKLVWLVGKTWKLDGHFVKWVYEQVYKH